METKFSYNKQKQIIADHLRQSTIFIVDQSGISKGRLVQVLKELGADSKPIQTFSDITEAQEAIKLHKPNIIFTDYKVKDKSGFDLLECFEKKDRGKNDLFILITNNSSQSVVASAAEEDVDAFILKPYTKDVIEAIIVKTAVAKIYPSKYMQKIGEGKSFMEEEEYEAALECFEKATHMSQTPTLAHFYFGHCQLLIKATEEAEESFEKGLEFNKIHYKCLLSLYDLMLKEHRPHDAYEIIKTLMEFYPANPKRLADTIHLAVKTDHFTDIGDYYPIYANFEDKAQFLLDYMSAGLLISGKFYLLNKMIDKGIEAFNKTAQVSRSDSKYLLIASEYLTEFSLAGELEKYLSKFAIEDKEKKEYKLAQFLSESFSKTPLTVFEKTTEMINEGIRSSSLYHLAIKNGLTIHRKQEAEKIFNEALEIWPEKKDLFIASRTGIYE